MNNHIIVDDKFKDSFIVMSEQIVQVEFVGPFFYGKRFSYHSKIQICN